MEIKFDFDGAAFERQVRGAINDGVKSYAKDLERALNGLGSRYRGRPLTEIQPALRSTWKRATGDGDITEPELTTYAEAIRDGGRIEISSTVSDQWPGVD